MSGVLFYNPLARQLSISGAILPGWTAAFYISGTTTPADVYEDGDLQTPHENPVVADSDGHMPPIYLDPDVTYRCIIKDADGVTVPDGDIDPIDVSRGSGGGGGGSGPPIAFARVSAAGALQAGSVGIASINKVGDGVYGVIFEEDFFAGTPACVVSILEADTNAVRVAIDSPSSEEVIVKTYDGSDEAANCSFHIIAAGPAS